jgi:putative ABC transport system permease protein
MSVLRDIFRRRLRSLLTIFGVSVGVFALVVLGAIAEKSDAMLRTTSEYYTDKVTVTEEKAAGAFGWNLSGDRPLSRDTIEQLRAYPGVTDVAPEIQLMLDDQAIPMGTPSMVLGSAVGTDLHPEPRKVADGRMIRESESGVALVGPDLVGQLGAKVGGHVTVRGEEFDVVGITERSYDVVDQSVVVSLADAQVLFAKTLPPAFASSVQTDSLYMQATAYVEKGRDADEMASQLNHDIAGIKATGPTELKANLGSWVAVINAILVSVGSVALIVGGLSVVNTMMMSLSERNREVGLKRALGASRWRVGYDVLVEAGVMGLLGGLFGLLLAAGAVAALNAAGAAAGGVRMFLMTPRLALGALVFATLLGGIAGLYPAWRTSRADPVSLLAAR